MQSGAHLDVGKPHERNPMTGERPVTITGTAEAISMAQYLIMQTIQSAAAPGMGVPGMGMPGQVAAPAAPSAGDATVTTYALCV